MVACKYFQQGNCRFGDYCRFKHIINFGSNQNDRSKGYGDSKTMLLSVAEEILAAEKGRQWLLSCFGPFKEGECIPGMEDVSPDEVRWEMYQAQKNGTVEQTKLQIQQLWQQMSAKRDELKNPNHEILAMLEKIQKGQKDSAFQKSGFTLSTPQLSSNMTGSGMFATKTYGGNTANQFISSANSSIFGRSTNTTTSAFGGKPAFGGNAVFGSPSPATGSSLFGGASSGTSTSIFGSSQTTLPSFGAAAQAPSIFGSSSNTQTFGQGSIFAGANQSNQATFGGQSMFGGAQSSSFFGGTTNSPTNPIFGGASTTNNSMFSQPKAASTFGSAPVFGGVPAFGATPSASLFGNQTNFTAANSFTATSTFGSNAQATNSFSALATPNQGAFTAQSAPFFGNPTTTAFATPTTSSFGNTSFGNSSPFSRPFATSANTSLSFGQPTPSISSTSTFGSPITPGFSSTNTQPSFTPSTFAPQNTPFAPTTTTSTTTNSNPFGVATTTTSASSVGGVGGMSTGLFSNQSQFRMDASDFYSTEEELTEEEKNSYLASEFILGKIPINPPTIQLR